MLESQSNSQATFTKVFATQEDDLVDSLLSLLRKEGWEDLKFHYEAGTLSATRIELRTHTFEGVKEEVAVTFAISASWFDSDGEVELMVEVLETEFDWTQDECASLCDSILTVISNTYRTIDSDGNIVAKPDDDTDEGENGRNVEDSFEEDYEEGYEDVG